MPRKSGLRRSLRGGRCPSGSRIIKQPNNSWLRPANEGGMRLSSSAMRQSASREHFTVMRLNVIDAFLKEQSARRWMRIRK
eukprot:3272263-Prymnesium_polylepis.1